MCSFSLFHRFPIFLLFRSVVSNIDCLFYIWLCINLLTNFNIHAQAPLMHHRICALNSPNSTMNCLISCSLECFHQFNYNYNSDRIWTKLKIDSRIWLEACFSETNMNRRNVRFVCPVVLLIQDGNAVAAVFSWNARERARECKNCNPNIALWCYTSWYHIELAVTLSQWKRMTGGSYSEDNIETSKTTTSSATAHILTSCYPNQIHTTYALAQTDNKRVVTHHYRLLTIILVIIIIIALIRICMYVCDAWNQNLCRTARSYAFSHSLPPNIFYLVFFSRPIFSSDA